jgi:hypothetical protein
MMGQSMPPMKLQQRFEKASGGRKPELEEIFQLGVYFSLPKAEYTTPCLRIAPTYEASGTRSTLLVLSIVFSKLQIRV